MSAAQALRSVARPKQARSEESLRKLLDATEALIEERGFAAITIGDIVRRCESSVGGFYARFRDKDELLLALHERFVRELEHAFAEIERRLPEHAELSALLDESLALLIDVHRERRGLLSAFAARAADNRRLQHTAIAFRRAVVARFTKLVLRARESITHPDAELAAELAVQLALGFMEQSLLSGRVRALGEPLDDAALKRELERALRGYLGVPDGARR